MAEQTLQELQTQIAAARGEVAETRTAITNIRGDISRILENLPQEGSLTAEETAQVRADLQALASETAELKTEAQTLDQENEETTPPVQ